MPPFWRAFTPPISDRAIVAVITDTHGGHRGSLLNPGMTLELFDQEGNPYHYHPEPTAVQEFLWGIFTDAIARIIELANGCPVYVLHLGDLVEGDKHTSEVMFPDMAAQIQIGLENLKPLCAIPNVIALRIVIGTEAHEYMFANATRLISAGLKNAYPELDIQMIQHGYDDIHGVKIDYSHHGPTQSRRQWLRGNEARYYLRNAMYEDISQDGYPADVYLRGHVHAPVIEYLQVGKYWSTLVVVPSMKIGGQYSFKMMRSNPSVTVGMMAIEIEAGRVKQIHDYTVTKDLRTREVFRGR